MQTVTELLGRESHSQIVQEEWTTTTLDLTIEICSEDGSWTEFYQKDPERIARIRSSLITPRFFSQPFLILASEQSVSTIPCQTIDMILVRTAKTPPLFLPPGCLDIVEMGAEAFYNEAILNTANYSDEEVLTTRAEGATSYVEVHTIGNWMISLRMLVMTQEQRQRVAHLFELPILPFRLEKGGVGFINPAKISHVTVYPGCKGIAESALPAALRRCIRR